MTPDTALIALVVVGFAFALLCALIVSRIGLPPLVGYLLAGVLVGPFTPGFNADAALAHQMAEIGVVLLMFGVGMHVSLADLLAVRKVALPGALGAFVLANTVIVSIVYWAGGPFGMALVMSFALTVSSTVVLLRILEAASLLQAPIGRLAIGWLVVEDMLTVLLLVALPTLAVALAPGGNADGLLFSLVLTLGKVILYIGAMLIVGGRILPVLLTVVSNTRSRELFTLAVMVLALGIGFGTSEYLGLSHALGAFFAGLVVNGTSYSERAQRETEPLQDMFAVLFFVSVGMVVDPWIVVRDPLGVLTLVGAILLVKPCIAFGLLRLTGERTRGAATIAAGLAQIGEFSFILAAMGVKLGLMPASGQDLILAAALIAITINPLLFRLPLLLRT